MNLPQYNLSLGPGGGAPKPLDHKPRYGNGVFEKKNFSILTPKKDVVHSLNATLTTPKTNFNSYLQTPSKNLTNSQPRLNTTSTASNFLSL